ncbi:MAG: PH domain-containing protein, partial [Planctomycetota bacterium]
MSDSAKQAIAGVSPASTAEATVMTVFPSVAKFGLGRALGLGYENQAGAYIFRLGNLIALLSIPIAL